MDNQELLWLEFNWERNSADQVEADKYKNGNFLNSLEKLIGCLQSEQYLP